MFTSAPRRVPEIRRSKWGGNMPGEIAWAAFCHASIIVVCMWTLSIVWTFYKMVLVATPDYVVNATHGEHSLLLHAGCAAVEDRPAMQPDQGSLMRIIRSSPSDLSSLAKAMR